ncbi:Crp/Fnr family transcriptional regulator [Herbaspirillum sp. ST 5-3]|uniref:Crp/Fnr family transcriptional regulator n=1 Tax=Oxalobacteraceae TaxID=75682 RepID=UPI0010A45656|nr:Crp/Fnr family transcriptional regulator [Herbaspirillum sp. ST 5-3]
MQEIKRILSETPLFQSLSPYQLGMIAAGARVIHATAETSVICPGDAADGMFVIGDGQVRIGFELCNGGERIIAILGMKQCFGLGEMLLERRYLTFGRMTRDSVLLHVNRPCITAVVRENFAFTHALLSHLGNQFHALLRDIESHALHSARQRIADYLLRQQRQAPGDCIELVACKALIAARLSLAPTTFSRELQGLCGEGVISVAGRRVRILNEERMQSLLQ